VAGEPLPLKSPGETCNARTRSGGYCRRPAGWGTSHPGRGHCRQHLGRQPGTGLRGVRELTARRSSSLDAATAERLQRVLDAQSAGDDEAEAQAIAALKAHLLRGEGAGAGLAVNESGPTPEATDPLVEMLERAFRRELEDCR
jgi:hypothetical protein